jgi:hypothetical protein
MTNERWGVFLIEANQIDRAPSSGGRPASAHPAASSTNRRRCFLRWRIRKKLIVHSFHRAIDLI